MKKFLTLGALALAVAALSNQQATAWTNCRFGIGMNLSRQAGGNNFAWGLFRNGQPPCAGDCGCMPPPCSSPYGYSQAPLDQGPNGLFPPNPTAGNVPAQPQSYSRPNFTVNYRSPYSNPYNYNYNYGYNYNNAYNYNYGSNYGYNYYNYGYNR